MRIITVRHAQSEFNSSGLATGWMDVELSREGLRQLQKISERLKNEKIDVIYSSDLKRACRTAEEIAKFHDCEFILDERLREQNKGKYQGSPAKRAWDDFRASGEDIFEWTPKEGESLGSVKKRIMDFFDEIKDKHKDRTVLIVSHGGGLAILSRYFYNEPELGDDLWKKHKHKNTSVSEYVFDGKKWNIVKFNCMEHLK